VFYLPDFFLPRSGQYVEVKGEWSAADQLKADAMFRHLERRPHVGLEDDTDVVLIVAKPDGELHGFSRVMDEAGAVSQLLTTPGSLALAQWDQCEGWWFFDQDAGWACHCCGFRDGRKHFRQILSSPLAGWPNVELRAA
jgi:hypothetical protein